MTKRVLRLACFAAATVVYKAEKIARQQTGDIKRCSQCNDKESKIRSAIEQTRKHIMRLKNEVGAPGIVVGVSVDGKVIWKEGIGFSDLENEVPAHEDTVMRIASISKSLTAAVVGRLWQDGIIDIDQPIQKYVPSFPGKTYGDKLVTITTRQLMCHLSGIRHYYKMKKDDSVGAGDGQLLEFYGKEKYETVDKALSIFKDDDLLHPPGTKYLYTTYGWTVVSAIMEGATSKTYPQLMQAFLREMGMRRTYLDEPEPIIYGRSKCYGKNKNGRIINSPYVDNSCKWAGGGILSTVGDLLKFANAMLYAYQFGGPIDISKAKQIVGVVKGEATRKIIMSQEKDNGKKNMVKGTDKTVTGNEVFSESKDSSKAKQVVRVAEGEPTQKVIVSHEEDNRRKVLSTSPAEKYNKGERADGGSSSSDVESAEIESSPTNLDQIKKVGRYAGTAVKYIGKGVATVGGYVWGKMRPTSEKQEEKEIVADDVSTSDSDVRSSESEENPITTSNIDRVKEVGSHAGAAVKYVGQGVANAGSYVWDQVWSTFGKQGEREEDNDENRVSNVDRIKDVGSQAGTAVKNVGQGVANAGSYVWDQVWSTFGKQEEKDSSSMKKQSEATIFKESWYSTFGYLWKRPSSNDGKIRDKEVNNNEQESRSWSVYFKNIFSPKALDSFSGEDFHHGSHSNNKKPLHEIPPMDEVIFQGILLKKIIPSAVNVVLGRSDQDTFDGKIIEDYSGYFSRRVDDAESYTTEQVRSKFGKQGERKADDENRISNRGKEIYPSSVACNFHLHVPEKSNAKSVMRPYISQKTVASLWTRVENTKLSDWGPYVEGGYGLGFSVAPAVDCPGGVDEGGQPFLVGHTGGAVGASSALIIMPRDCGINDPPQGVAVVILTNLQSVSLNPLAIEIARLFANATQ